MGEKNTSSFCSQLRAVLVRNLLLKKRNTRNTIAEVFLPLYSLGSLILLKILIPNPNFPVMAEPRGEAKIFEHFQQFKNHTVAVAPNNTNTLHFLDSVNELWLNMRLDPGLHPINWVVFESRQELQKEYWREPLSMPLALIFNGEDPLNGPLQYEIRTNPNFVSTPSTLELYTSPAVCRQSGSHWSGVFPIEAGDSCPVNQYYYSGFIALQALLDYTKIRLASGSTDIQVPHILLEMFPKDAYTGNWMVAFRVVIPLYMVIALSQFITYLLILIVGEKENKIKEGMKIMGLRDSVFWLSWFIIYAVFVTVLTAITTVLLFSLGVFQNTSPLPVFLIILLYSYSVIMFGFMITPFFDNSRTAGILGNFAVNIMSLLYFIQVFVDNSSSVALWVVSLISPTGFALAMDKILVLDIQGSGVTLDNLWAGPGIPIGGSLIMMSLDIVLYGFLAYYLDCVIPSEHGTKRSPWFCFTPRFWCGKKSSAKIPLTNGESTSFNNAEEQIRDVEQVPREMKGREAIRIVDLYKTFHKCRKPEVRAVNGINLTIYEGQITAILGHNGAGKSTLFNILTGLTAPSSGTAYVFGYDIRDQNDMQQIRRMTGVCPQHDILFDLLTPREHLKFFAAVRGIPADSIEHEVNKTLRDIDMSDNADQYAKYLSGGQKRKLSVGIAIIGDPRIIILDEPTAGVDPYSRRHMWRLLQERKHGKVILLTTHFMDEADILAERKAVVSRGKLRCCGSSLFLKNKFGIGYHLTLVLDGVCREVAITRLVCQHVTKAERGRRHGRELSFILPHDAVDHFAPLFTSIEAEINTKANRLGICSYGVSMTTLEEVFLHLERDENETEVTMDNLSKKMVRNRALSRSLSLQSKSTSYQSLQNDAIASELDPSNKAQGDFRPTRGTAEEVSLPHGVVGLGLDDVKMEPSVARTLVALLRLRVLRLFRDLQKLYLMIAMPLVFAPIGLYLNSIQVVSPKMNSLMLNGATYGSDTLFLLHNATWGDNLDPLHDSLEETGATVEPYDGNFSLLLDIAPHMAALNVNVFSLPNLSFTLIYNDTTQHGLPVAMNLLSNAMYGLLTGEMSFDSIQTFAHPLQQTSQPQGFNFGTFAASFCIGTIFVLMPISLAVEMVYDREIKAKNQLRVNGLSSNLYFFTYFLVLATLMVLICFVLLLLILLFDLPALEEPPAMITLGSLLILYCPASILFTTCVSYIFDKADSAQSILPNITTFVGLLPAALVMMLDMFQVGGRAAYALHVVFSLVNPMYLPFAVLYYVDRVHVTCLMNGVCGVNGTLTLADYCTNEIVVMLVGVLLHIPIWFVVLQVLDIYKSGGRVADVFKCFLPKRPDKLPEDPGAHCDGDGDNEDADVQLEREKVRNLQVQHHYGDDAPVVVVQNLRKEFPLHEQCRCSTCCSPAEPPTMRVAVRNLSLAVDAGEVLGLLGHNGAGKTTTMRIITAEMHPTRGRVQIGGHNITSSLNEAFRTLGYCPQHDALWKDITVREHLQVYAAIKGVPSRHIDGLVNLYLTGLQIDEHANKQAQHCSGGTRRKLSFAIAMVGSPRVVLLDEPSTGMDPRSKRFLWDTILASFQGSRGAILTTHSMEEADALCSRVGIMVKGELRCLGSTQHLKNLYGAGYTLEIKLKTGTDTPTGTVLPDTGDEGGAVLSLFTGGLFPDATLLESFADRLVYSVPQHAVTSLAQCFKELERAKDELHIEEYSFSQTTLEQVFLKFAQHDEEAVTQEAI